MRITEADRESGSTSGPAQEALSSGDIGVPVFDRTRTPPGSWPSLCGYAVCGC